MNNIHDIKYMNSLLNKLFMNLFEAYKEPEVKKLINDLVKTRLAFCEENKLFNRVSIVKEVKLDIHALIFKQQYIHADVIDKEDVNDIISTILVNIALNSRTPVNLLETEEFNLVCVFCSKYVVVKYNTDLIVNIISRNYDSLTLVANNNGIDDVLLKSGISTTTWYDEVLEKMIELGKSKEIIKSSLSRFIIGHSHSQRQLFDNPFEYGMLRRWTKNNSRVSFNHYE